MSNPGLYVFNYTKLNLSVDLNLRGAENAHIFQSLVYASTKVLVAQWDTIWGVNCLGELMLKDNSQLKSFGSKFEIPAVGARSFVQTSASEGYQVYLSYNDTEFRIDLHQSGPIKDHVPTKD